MKSKDPYFLWVVYIVKAKSRHICAFTLDIAVTDSPPAPFHTHERTPNHPERERERDRQTDRQRERDRERDTHAERGRGDGEKNNNKKQTIKRERV